MVIVGVLSAFQAHLSLFVSVGSFEVEVSISNEMPNTFFVISTSIVYSSVELSFHFVSLLSASAILIVYFPAFVAFNSPLALSKTIFSVLVATTTFMSL